MSFGIFEAAVGSEVEAGLAKQASVDKLATAVYDVREKLGPILFASRDLEEFRHKIAMMKEDQSLFKVVEASGLFPLPRNIRKVVGTLTQEFRQQLAMRKGAPFAGYEDFDDCTSKNSDKDDSDAYCGEIKHRTEDKKESRRRSAGGTVDVKPAFEDHRGQDLEPEGNFKSYLDERSQGAEDKISDNFVGEPVQEHTEDPAKHNFASRQTVARYQKFCKQRGLSPIRLSSLDAFANASRLTTAGYFRLAETINAWESEHHPKTPSTKLPKSDKVARQRRAVGELPVGPANSPGAQSPQGSRPVVDIINQLGDPADVTGRQGARKHIYARHYLAWCRQHQLAPADVTNLRHYGHYTARVCPEGFRYVAAALKRTMSAARRRYAAPDYLQKADDALTQLLNQKAEEFQQTIAPLQQALITVQQAEQLQQQQNPLNVLPPPGTVNVMPGQPNSTPGQLGMPDPNQPDISGLVQALQPGGGAMGGVAPQDDGGQGAPPPAAAAGGGLPPEMDPSQKAARRGKGRGAVRPRQAAGVGELWDRWKQNRSEQGDALRGDEVDYQRFQNEHGVGDRAIQHLKKRNETPDFAPINGQGRGRSPQGITVGRRRQGVAHEVYPPQYYKGEIYNPSRSGLDYHDPNPPSDAPDSFKVMWERSNSGKNYPGTRSYEDVNKSIRDNSGPGGMLGPEQMQKIKDSYSQKRARRRNACWPGCHENEAHAAKFHSKDKKESRRRQAGPYDPGPEYDAPPQTDDFHTFNDRGQGQDHPGRSRGWKGQFAQEPQGPYDGEYYTKGRATVRGGPGPDVAKYWLTTPHGMHGPHNNVHDAFDAAEPFLAQDAEISQGQGVLPGMPGAKGDARPRTPLARRKRAEVPGGLDQGKHSIGDPDDGHPPILNPTNPYTGGGMFDEAPDLTPRAARKSYRKQAWTGWGPAVFPKARKVAGWDWDDHLNGYLANKPQHFACECGDQFPTPSGFQRCACGRQWNSYVIGSGGSNKEAAAEKFIVREVPVRPDVIVANRKLAAKQACGDAIDEENLSDEVKAKRKGYVRLVDRQGNIHNLIDPGEVGEGEDPKHPTFRKQPKDWAKRSGDGKWTPSAIG